MAFSVADIAEAKAFRISPKDTNYFVMIFDEETDEIDNIFVIEAETEDEGVSGRTRRPYRISCRAAVARSGTARRRPRLS